MFGHSAFSETALVSASVNVRVIPSSLLSTGQMGDVTLNFGATIIVDNAALTATTAIGDPVISISARVDVTSMTSASEMGDVRVYGLLVPDRDGGYSNVTPITDSNYINVIPAPAREWNDLVT